MLEEKDNAPVWAQAPSSHLFFWKLAGAQGHSRGSLPGKRDTCPGLYCSSRQSADPQEQGHPADPRLTTNRGVTSPEGPKNRPAGPTQAADPLHLGLNIWFVSASKLQVLWDRQADSCRSTNGVDLLS